MARSVPGRARTWCYRHRAKRSFLLGSLGDATAVMAQFFGEIGERAFLLLLLARHAGVVDADHHHRDADDAFQAVVEGCTGVT